MEVYRLECAAVAYLAISTFLLRLFFPQIYPNQ